MKTGNNTILITGGATGIGLALTRAFAKLGNEVIICGRREDRLKSAAEEIPGIHTIKCDVSDERDRKRLYDWTASNFKEVNILLNNAGIQRRIDFRKGIGELLSKESELRSNLESAISLSAYFTPSLMAREHAAIINVSSGLGFVPLARYPIYCATKAAMHSFSVSLRYQLKDTNVKVFEVVPPTVRDTELKTAGGDAPVRFGVTPQEVADATLKALEEDRYEAFIGDAEKLALGSKAEKDAMFTGMNERVPV